jgi:hypothetical protein
MLLHVLLGVGLTATGIETLIRALRDSRGVQAPLAAAAAITVVGGILFLLPRTVRVGGALLLLVVLAVFAEQVLRGQWRLEFAVYAAAILFVTVHGAVWGRQPERPVGSSTPEQGIGAKS